MGGKVMDLNKTIHQLETDRQVGYLLRAVEDLTEYLKGHMDREEDLHTKSNEDLSDFKEECRITNREIKERVDKLSYEVDNLKSDIKKYLKFTAFIIICAGGVLGKLEPSSINSLVNAVSKLLL